HRLDPLNEGAVLLEVLALKARMALSRIAIGEIGKIRDDPGQKRAAKRRIGDKGDPEIARQYSRFLGDLAIEKGKFALHRGGRMGGGAALEARGLGSARPENAPLPGFHPPAPRAARVLDRDIGVDAVLQIEIDDLDAEALQARIARRADIFGTAIAPAGAA